MTTDIALRPATAGEMAGIVEFMMQARASMFPMLDEASHREHAQRELAAFQGAYLDHPEGAFWTAWANGRLIGTIGCVAYDNRFAHLDLDLERDRIVEIVRLYVDPAWRRAGVASRLFCALKQTARRAGIRRLYMHTHPFLPGAIAFWERHGFELMAVDRDPVWHTTHMSRLVDE